MEDEKLPKTNISAPKNGGFPSSESPNFQGFTPIFRGVCYVSFRECFSFFPAEMSMEPEEGQLGVPLTVYPWYL